MISSDADRWVGDVLVVGAGPGGMAAAHEAATAGLKVLLIDENQRAGGQINRQRFLSSQDDSKRGIPSLESGFHPNICFRAGTICHGFRDDSSVVLSTKAGLLIAQPRAVVLATGAVEKVLPVPGWTLSGVMTVGAAQSYLKGSGVFPYRRVLVAGTGPLLLAAAAQLHKAGVQVVGVVEAARPGPLQFLDAARLLSGPSLLAQGGQYLAVLAKAGIRPQVGVGVRRIAGDRQVSGVWLSRLRTDWSLVDAPAKFVACDAVLLSYGFSSATELASQAGAKIEWDKQRETWRPTRDENFRTTVEHVYAVGDCAGVGGARIAELEGQIAGIMLSAELAGSKGTPRRLRRCRRKLAHLEVFRIGMDNLFRPGSGASSWQDPTTQVCRCQGSTRADIDAALDDGVKDLASLKLWTRAGMGDCQGRTCALQLAAILSSRGHPEDGLMPPTTRFPVRPLHIDLLCRLTESTADAAPHEGA